MLWTAEPQGFAERHEPAAFTPGDRTMIRLLAAALFLTLAAAPAFACPWQSVTTDSKSSTVASQPTDDQATPPPAPAPSDQKQG
jgi:hypothetical protein